jgi:hypothetical protein
MLYFRFVRFYYCSLCCQRQHALCAAIGNNAIGNNEGGVISVLSHGRQAPFHFGKSCFSASKTGLGIAAEIWSDQGDDCVYEYINHFCPRVGMTEKKGAGTRMTLQNDENTALIGEQTIELSPGELAMLNRDLPANAGGSYGGQQVRLAADGHISGLQLTINPAAPAAAKKSMAQKPMEEQPAPPFRSGARRLTRHQPIQYVGRSKRPSLQSFRRSLRQDIRHDFSELRRHGLTANGMTRLMPKWGKMLATPTPLAPISPISLRSSAAFGYRGGRALSVQQRRDAFARLRVSEHQRKSHQVGPASSRLPDHSLAYGYVRPDDQPVGPNYPAARRLRPDELGPGI